MLRLLGNFLWFVLGGAVMGLAWWLAGLLAFLSIVGIPWARACLVIGRFAFFPFGHEAIRRPELSGRQDIGSGFLGRLGNVLWFVLGGWWLALGHLAAALCCAATLVGIPFAVQHLKLAILALAPIGRTIVASQVAVAARRANAASGR